MKKFSLTSCLLLCLALAIWAQAADPMPAWYKDPAATYPAKDFLQAVGEGKDATLARQDALEQLSRFFGVSVQTLSQSTMSYQESDKGSQSKLEVAIASKVSSSSKHQLFNVEMTPVWKAAEGRFAVLAFIKKAPALEAWLAIQKDLNDRLGRGLAKLENSQGSRGFLFATLIQSNELARQAKSMDAMRRLADSNADKLGLDSLVQRLETIRPKILEASNIKIRSSGTNGEDILPLIEAQLSDAGFLTGEKGVMTLDARFSIKSTSSSYGIGGTQWNLDVKLLDDGTALLAMALQGKATGSTAEKAKEKAANDATAQFQARFLPELLEKLSKLLE